MQVLSPARLSSSEGVTSTRLIFVTNNQLRAVIFYIFTYPELTIIALLI
jgi:hypothetical protein